MAATGEGEDGGEGLGEESDPGGLGTASDSDLGGWVQESVRNQVEAVEEAPWQHVGGYAFCCQTSSAHTRAQAHQHIILKTCNAYTSQHG